MKTKQQLKMCEECITHIELNAYQSNLKLYFLLLSRIFIPNDKRPITMVSVGTVCFQEEIFEHRCWTDITEARNDNGTSVYTPSITTVSNNDYNNH